MCQLFFKLCTKILAAEAVALGLFAAGRVGTCNVDVVSHALLGCVVDTLLYTAGHGRFAALVFTFGILHHFFLLDLNRYRISIVRILFRYPGKFFPMQIYS
jgi:hypothetical protein